MKKLLQHSLNFVHRDIKAENIIFSRPDVLKLIDFGFSCGCPDDTMLSTSCGSPPYAAPELFRDKNYSGNLIICFSRKTTLRK